MKDPTLETGLHAALSESMLNYYSIKMGQRAAIHYEYDLTNPASNTMGNAFVATACSVHSCMSSPTW